MRVACPQLRAQTHLTGFRRRKPGLELLDLRDDAYDERGLGRFARGVARGPTHIIQGTGNVDAQLRKFRGCNVPLRRLFVRGIRQKTFFH